VFDMLCNKRALAPLLIVSAFALCAQLWAANIDDQFGKKEIDSGKEAAAQVAKDHKLITDSPDLKRIRAIGEKLAAAANKTETKAVYGSSKVTPFEYSFNLVDDKDINAFSLPGGYIYVNTGLLKFMQSDQELAGVLAHEVTHAAHHHMVYLLSKQAAINNEAAIALLAAIITGAKSADIGNVLLGAQLYQISKLNGYGMQAERDADQGAVFYMREAGYNPVGLLTFLERLSMRPELTDLGIYRSHPLDAERVKAAKKILTDLKIPINRRDTTNAIKAEVKTDKVNGTDVPGVYIQSTLVYRPSPLNGKTPADRAQATADAINQAFDIGIQMRELTSDPTAGVVVARYKVIITVSDADAKLMGKSVAEVTKAAANAVRTVIWKQMVDTVQ